MPNQNETNSKLDDLKADLQAMVQKLDMDNSVKEVFLQSIIFKIESNVGLATLQEKLSILYEYEKNYLELIKNYKEEIKFATSLQEEVRKERTKFFAESLKEVSETLSTSQVDNKVASVWIKELVESYTRSLDLSASLIEENTLDMVSEIKQEARKEMDNAKMNSGLGNE
ncbi:nickel transporter [Phormidium tenue FACHB-1052]|uniref:Nickel transporter n=2 Tax=Phormidium tenue TaxID=126344 RepID=A0A1U7J2H7_9CYAN|nr:nickel transporter [Phormidium tenue FACHB-1052]OKH46212.1 hypothetical protein NIES30_17840 [Phormidium tenue NIES-30]